MTWRSRLVAAVCVWGAMAGPGCATTSPVEAPSDQFVGQPPTPDEDPFALRGQLGARAELVEDRGEIRERVEPEVVEEAPEVEAPRPTAQEPRQVEAEAVVAQCISCVQICPQGEVCDDAGQDVICGWGAHDSERAAADRARAECEGALELARQMPVWSRIEGSCPQATCER